MKRRGSERKKTAEKNVEEEEEEVEVEKKTILI